MEGETAVLKAALKVILKVETMDLKDKMSVGKMVSSTGAKTVAMRVSYSAVLMVAWMA